MKYNINFYSASFLILIISNILVNNNLIPIFYNKLLNYIDNYNNNLINLVNLYKDNHNYLIIKSEI